MEQKSAPMVGKNFLKSKYENRKLPIRRFKVHLEKSLFFFNKITGVELRIIITVPYGKVKKEKKNRSDRGKKRWIQWESISPWEKQKRRVAYREEE